MLQLLPISLYWLGCTGTSAPAEQTALETRDALTDLCLHTCYFKLQKRTWWACISCVCQMGALQQRSPEPVSGGGGVAVDSQQDSSSVLQSSVTWSRRHLGRYGPAPHLFHQQQTQRWCSPAAANTKCVLSGASACCGGEAGTQVADIRKGRQHLIGSRGSC